MNSPSPDLRRALPLFDGFPYLNVRVVPALYHIILLPAGLSDTHLCDAAEWQVLANRLPLCLVLARDRAIYWQPEGQRCATDEPPVGGNIIADSLAPAILCEDSIAEFRTRQNRLARMVDQVRRRGGYLNGDRTKGRRAATDEEKHCLAGVLSDGTPRGLSRCVNCGDWTGVCFDPSDQFAGQVTTVHCYCDNHNRCGCCHERLFKRRLNANYYDPAHRCIFHVPGFCGLSHRCTADALAHRCAS